MCRLRDIDIFIEDDFGGCKCKSCRGKRVTKTFCLARVNGTAGDFTVASYSGPGARKVRSGCSSFAQTFTVLFVGIRPGFLASVKQIVRVVKILEGCRRAEEHDLGRQRPRRCTQ